MILFYIIVSVGIVFTGYLLYKNARTQNLRKQQLQEQEDHEQDKKAEDKRDSDARREYISLVSKKIYEFESDCQELFIRKADNSKISFTAYNYANLPQRIINLYKYVIPYFSNQDSRYPDEKEKAFDRFEEVYHEYYQWAIETKLYEFEDGFNELRDMLELHYVSLNKRLEQEHTKDLQHEVRVIWDEITKRIKDMDDLINLYEHPQDECIHTKDYDRRNHAPWSREAVQDSYYPHLYLEAQRKIFDDRITEVNKYLKFVVPVKYNFEYIKTNAKNVNVNLNKV